MTSKIEWYTKKINIQDYYKIIMRYCYILGGKDFWNHVKTNVQIIVIPSQEADKYKHFFSHLNGEKFSDRMAWGIKGMNQIILAVDDTRNMFIIRSNAVVILHELAHELVYWWFGNMRTRYLRNEPPEGYIGKEGNAHTVMVHDNYYGFKDTFKFWIFYMMMWLPITGMYFNKNLLREKYRI